MKRVLKELSHNKNLEENLPRFGAEMTSLYYRFAYVHLSMNYYGYYEVMTESRSAAMEAVKIQLQELNTIIHTVMLPGVCGQELVDALAKTDEIRNQIIHTMQVLTAYTDIFNLYEHVLNRIEYRFKHGHFPEEYKDEDFCRQIMQYIVSDQDNMVINTKITQVIRQLPVRMTKNHFFELVENGLSIYENNGKTGLDDFLYMIRTAATLDQPDGMEAYRDLQEIYGHLKQADYTNIDGDTFLKLQNELKYASAFLQEVVDAYVMLTDLVNDVYTILLATPYAMAETQELQACRSIILAVCSNFQSGDLDPLGDVIMDQLIFLEGRQEEIHEQCASMEYMLDDVLNTHGELLESLMLDAQYRALSRMMLLQSGSQFVLLDKKITDDAIADADYVAKQVSSLVAEFTQLFQNNHKMVNRAAMAAVLSELPVFFNNLQELQDYIYEALNQCRDEAEKKACIELLQEIMEEY